MQADEMSIFALPLLRIDKDSNEILDHITFLNNIDSELPYEVDDVLGHQKTYWRYLDKNIVPSKLI